jgi:hypothetical protein
VATPGHLVRVMADILGIPEPTVVQHDRNLAAAGLRSKSGRGLSAARVTSLDAANLLISICAASPFGASVKESITTYERFAMLKAHRGAKLEDFSRVAGPLPTLGSLRKGHLFRDALAALIDSIAFGEFTFLDGGPTGTVYVSLDDPGPAASIRIERLKAVALSYGDAVRSARSKPDLWQNRGFSDVTLRELARVVDPKRPEPQAKDERSQTNRTRSGVTAKRWVAR